MSMASTTLESSLHIALLILEMEVMVEDLVGLVVDLDSVVVEDLVGLDLEVFHRNPQTLGNCRLVCCCRIPDRLGMACKSSGSPYTGNRMHS